MTEVRYIPPEGGWGWVVMFAFALSNITVIPIIQGFGIVWGKQFKDLGISATQSTIIMNINQAFGMILGMMNGPLIRKYGYRKVAILGSIIFSCGVILTSFGTTFIHFVITYGMMTSLGMMMNIAAFSFAISTYFKEKRGRAMGWCMTITGIGPIIIPQLTSLSLKSYASKGTMLLLGALSLHGFVGSLLLQPIKWHAKKEKPPLEMIEKDEIKDEESKSLLDRSKEKSIMNLDKESKKCTERSRTTTISSTDFNDDNSSVYGLETPYSIQTGSILDMRDIKIQTDDSKTEDDDYKHLGRRFSLNDYNRSNSLCENRTRKFSIHSIKYGDFALSNKVLLECPEEDGELTKSSSDDEQIVTKVSPTDEDPQSNETPESIWKQIFNRINTLFDLDLLRDPIYINIMLGMSIAIFAEINFSVLTPFILAEMHLTTHSVAVMMSATASSDLVLRAMAPYIGEWLKKPPRIMYLFSLFLLIVSRTTLMFARGFVSMIFVSIGLGIAKGVRTVYMTLVIPSYVPLNKLANASSIQSLANGFIMIIAGPCLGVIRDVTGSYVSCIILINILTAVTIIMWLAEFFITYIKKRRRQLSMIEIEQKENKTHIP